jgi:hypothetical protein
MCCELWEKTGDLLSLSSIVLCVPSVSFVPSLSNPFPLLLTHNPQPTTHNSLHSQLFTDNSCNVYEL